MVVLGILGWKKGLSCFGCCEIGTRNWHVGRSLINGRMYISKQGAKVSATN